MNIDIRESRQTKNLVTKIDQDKKDQKKTMMRTSMPIMPNFLFNHCPNKKIKKDNTKKNKK